MRTTVRSERGMALVMALSAIVLIGVLIGAIVFVSTQDSRISSNTVRATRAAAAAGMGLNRVPVTWNLADNNRLKVGDTLLRTYTGTNGATAKVTVTKVSGLFYWVVSEGTAGALGSQATGRRRYGSMLRIDMPNINFQGALTQRGNFTLSGSSSIVGIDTVLPAGYGSCPPKNDAAGIAIGDSSGGKVALNGCKTCVNGKPDFLITPLAADTSTYFNYGNATYQSMAAAANVLVPGGQTLNGIGPAVVGGVCMTAPATNWGDSRRLVPTGACESYMPIIHVLGDLHVSGGQGQGMMFVDGDLTMTGGFTFMGAVIVRGSLRMAGNGNKILGGAMAANIDISDNTGISGNSGIKYSSCALQQAMIAPSYPKPMRDRAWVDLY